MLQRISILFVLFFTSFITSMGQTSTPEISYTGKAKKYEIAEIEVVGDLNNDRTILANLSGLRVGQTITVPGDEITSAIKKYWDYGLFSDVKISASKIEGGKIFLNIYLQERPRLSEMNYLGLKKSEIEDINEKVAMMRGSQVTPYLITRAERFIKDHFVEKGFYNTEVDIVQRDDTSRVNHVILDVHVDKKEKVKVNYLGFEGNVEFSDNKLNRITKKTNQRKLLRNFFRTKKFVEDEYKADLDVIIEKYNEIGYRDAYILADSVVKNDDNTVDITIYIDEGRQYYFGEITWVGNSIYPGEFLGHTLRIKKGDIFNQTLLDERLFIDDDAVHNLYMNNGYLFSQIVPVDINISNDTVDLEMRIYEGDQATIDRVIIKGNTKTHEHVVRRELRTKPGDLFNKAALIRTVRELSQLGHFDPENINPVPIPNPEKGTVDLEYNLQEKANDQVELSGGWGAGMFVGSLGLKFSNFSMRNFFNKEAWKPLPTGDGQTLSVRAQTNGSYYQSYSLSFVEPWLGGKKPNSLSVNIYRSIQTGVSSTYSSTYYGYSTYGSTYSDPYAYQGDDSQHMKVLGGSVGLGKRLSWPDDYFSLYSEMSYQYYDLKEWSFLMRNGYAHNLRFKVMLSRRSIDNPLYTRTGSEFVFGVEATPPYSSISGKDYSNITDEQELYKLIEYHKWTFKGAMFKSMDRSNKLVLMSKIEGGFLGYYNKYLKSPFEKYVVGGDGMAGYSYYGSETIGLRGYENNTLTAMSYVQSDDGEIQAVQDANMYTKLTMELRYPLTLQPSATVYGLLFLEAGNSWSEFKDYSPFDLHRSAGVGVRIYLPMFGLLGLDWGYGFDDVSGYPDAAGGNIHFTMGQNF